MTAPSVRSSSLACRAAASAVRFAIDPPLTNNPPADSGNPHHWRNQSINATSIASAPDPPNHDPLNTLNPPASASAITLTKFDGPGTNAKNRGCEMFNV